MEWPSVNESIQNNDWHLAAASLPPDLISEQYPTLIEWAYLRAEKSGTTIDHFLIQNELVSAELLYRALASILGAPFTLKRLPIPPHLNGQIILKAESCPLNENPNIPSFAIAPTGESFVTLLIAASIGAVQFNASNVIITTPQNLTESVRECCGRAIAEKAVNKIKYHAPQLSAHPAGIVGSITFTFFIFSFFLLSLTQPGFWNSAVFLLTLFPGIPSIALKALALRQQSFSNPLNYTLVDQDLPIYTILVPLYRERKIIFKLIERLKKIDYPKAKLDIKLLIEADDIETRLALISEQLPSRFDIVICPLMKPRTKPRALNVGLAYAKGDFIVVYDAEDEPDSDQLKKAATYFHHGGKKLGCVQAHLAIDNFADAWISRMFALEYAGLFDALLPGMSKARQPIPLGGTSNHFRRSILEACLAWDPWNVTEDADLGLRLARLGYETAVIDSTTWEEAPNTLKAWINQRTRWLKGWMQTAVVLVRPLGSNRPITPFTMRFQITVISLASITSAMFNPLIVFGLGWALASPSTSEPMSLIEIAQWNIAGLVLLCHCVVSYWTICVGTRQRGGKLYWWDGLSLPLYSLLKCFAAWRALWEFIVAPSHWRKTEHGHSRTSRRITTKTR